MEMRKINSKVGEKRKPDETTPPSPNSHRKLQQDIRLFINKDVSKESRSGRVELRKNVDVSGREKRNGRVEPTECGTAWGLSVKMLMGGRVTCVWMGRRVARLAFL